MLQGANHRLLLRRRGRTTVALAAILTLSACATTSNVPLTPAQAQLKQQNERLVTTVAEGAVAGAVIGALLGYAIGGGRGAALGAGAGLAAGAATGYAVAQNNFRQARTESNLQGLIKQANDDADAYERSANASAQIAADLRAQYGELNAQYASRAISATQFQGQLANYRASAETMQKQLTSMDKETADLRADGSPQLTGAANRIDAARQREARALQELNVALSAVPAG